MKMVEEQESRTKDSGQADEMNKLKEEMKLWEKKNEGRKAKKQKGRR